MRSGEWPDDDLHNDALEWCLYRTGWVKTHTKRPCIWLTPEGIVALVEHRHSGQAVAGSVPKPRRKRRARGDVATMPAAAATTSLGSEPVAEEKLHDSAVHDVRLADVSPAVVDQLSAVLARPPRGEGESDRPPAPPSDDERAADAEELAIVQVLAKARTLLTVEVIARDAGVGDKTAGKRLLDLIAAGLVNRPNGPKRGAQLTVRGRVYAQRICGKTT
jgi:hypothetical protein